MRREATSSFPDYWRARKPRAPRKTLARHIEKAEAVKSARNVASLDRHFAARWNRGLGKRISKRKKRFSQSVGDKPGFSRGKWDETKRGWESRERFHARFTPRLFPECTPRATNGHEATRAALPAEVKRTPRPRTPPVSSSASVATVFSANSQLKIQPSEFSLPRFHGRTFSPRRTFQIHPRVRLNVTILFNCVWDWYETFDKRCIGSRWSSFV